MSGCLRTLGLELGRLKTGTPPRLERKTIDFAQFEDQPGDDEPAPFSYLNEYDESEHVGLAPPLPQVHCWIGATNAAIHEIIRANLHRAPMYSGQIASTGPRYCPSIEDKVVRFADKQSHHIFLEPEGLDTDEIYCNGISTVLPADVQEQIIRADPGPGERGDPAPRLRRRVRHGLADADPLDAGDEDGRGPVPRRPDQRHQRLRRGGGAGTDRGHQRRALRRRRARRISSSAATRPTSAC